MPMQAQQIVNLACSIAKVPGYTAYAGSLLNSVLQEIAQTYDFDAAKGTYNFNFNPSVTGGPLQNVTPGGGPYPMPSDYLRAERGDVMWFLLGVPYLMIPIDPAEYDQQVQQAGLQSYPYWFTVLMDQSPPLMYVYPPASGAYPVMVRYRKQMPDITTPETSTTIPWFPFDNYLVTRLAGELMKIADDSRWQAFLGTGPEGAQGILDRILKMVDDKGDRAQRVTLDRRRFGPRYSTLPSTKLVGW